MDPSMRKRAFLGAALVAALGCGGNGSKSESAPAAGGAATTPGAPGTPPAAAGADRVGTPLAAAPGDQPPLRAEALDDRRWVIDDALLTELAVDAAAGQVRARFGSDGVKLEAVADGSSLGRAGFAAGDVIASIAGQKVTGADQLRAAWATIRKDGQIVATVTRGGATSERRYYLFGALEPDLKSHLERLHFLGTGSQRVGAALRTGVKQTGPDSFDVDEKLLALAAAPAGTAPIGDTDGAARSGLRLSDQNCLLSALGLTRYDLVKAIDTFDLTSYGRPGDYLGKLAQDKAREFTITIVRIKEPLILRYRVVTDLVMDAELDAALAEWRELEGKLNPPPPTLGLGDGDAGVPLPPADADADAISAMMDAGIRKLSDTSWEIDRALIDKGLANPMAVSRGARVVPAIKNGKPDGFKLYAIRPSSFYAKIGLMNGDTIQRINGMDLTSMDLALKVYQKVKDAKVVVVDIIRRGKPVTQTYRIR
jgi:membrane-associated protease RseP (regulator of RpoE activity)